MRFTHGLIAALVMSVLFLSAGCRSISDISSSLVALDNLEFKLGGIQQMRVAGINISNVAPVSDLSVQDALSLTAAVQRRSLPVTFVLNVEARNPNSGGGSKRTVPLRLTGLDWKLRIDGVETVSGDLERPIEIPGSKDVVVIPLTVSLDLYRYFAEEGYDGLLKLAMALGGKQGSSARVQLDARPSVEAPFGSMAYPGRLTIIDTEFRRR